VRVQSGGRTYLRFVDGGNSFAGQSSARVHVGLGTAPQVDSVEVRWPSGLRQRFDAIPINRITRIVEGSSPVPFVPGLSR
jgi:enediyne biosynthesis protein E4